MTFRPPAPLPLEFYARETVTVARDLVGRVLVHAADGELLAGRIVEAEAYGPDDAANHAYRGLTPRNAAMFGPAGRAYVYRSYGMHWMFNVVTKAEGVGEAALIRALEPLAGTETMRRNRGMEDVLRLCKGPGSLCRALGITIALNGVDLTRPPLWIGGDVPPGLNITVARRIGITQAAGLPWRFYESGNPYVSRR